MRFLYSIGIYSYALAAKIWALKSQKARKFVNGQAESFEKLRTVFEKNTQPVIWFHAASLGEFEQGRPIIEGFRKERPEWKILLTFFSPSGYEIRKNYAQADCVIYLPFDTAKHAQKFVKLVQPKVAVFIKYEFWYNYLNALKKQDVRTFFVSAIFRPSQYFFKWYGGWARKQLEGVEHFFVQNQESENLLKSISFTNVTFSGDTRFDRVAEILQTKKPFPIIEKFKGNKRLLVVGSSWASDESRICKAFSLPASGSCEHSGKHNANRTAGAEAIFNEKSDFKLLFVPHEITEARLKKLEYLISNHFQVKSIRYSKATLDTVSDVQVMIVDEVGHLSQLYQYADVVYIGGGFEKGGIHNILEPAVFGVPIFFGKNHEKFQEVHDLIALNVAQSTTFDKFVNFVETEQDAALLQEVSTRASNYINLKKGATSVILKKIA